MGKFAPSLLPFPLSITLLDNYRYSSNGRDRSVYTINYNEVVLIFFHGSPHMPILIAYVPPFRFAYSRAKNPKTTTVYNLRASNSLTLPSAPCIFLLPSPPRTHQAHSQPIYRKIKQLPREHPGQHLTISNAIPRKLVSRRGILQHILGTF